MKNFCSKIIFISLTMVALASCSSAKQQLGLSKKSPDEFAVVKRAPLSMPPALALPPPRPGTPRPQEQATSDQARQAVFGTAETQAASAPEEGESILLRHAGAGMADPKIRSRIDGEATTLAKKEMPVAKKLLGLGGDPAQAPASVVDAKEEAERLKQNQQQGKPVTAGETPTMER